MHVLSCRRSFSQRSSVSDGACFSLVLVFLSFCRSSSFPSLEEKMLPCFHTVSSPPRFRLSHAECKKRRRRRKKETYKDSTSNADLSFHFGFGEKKKHIYFFSISCFLFAEVRLVFPLELSGFELSVSWLRVGSRMAAFLPFICPSVTHLFCLNPT